VFRHFLQLCTAAGPERCAFAEASYDLTAAKWRALTDRLAAGPVTLETAGGSRTLSLSEIIGQVSDGMDFVWPINGAGGWPAVAAALQALHEAGAAAPAPAPRPAPAADAAADAAPAPAAAPAPYDGAEGVIAIMCGDVPSVAAARYPTLASEAMLRSGYFGLSTSYVGFPCASWSIDAADPYLGPWDAETGAAPLVVNTTHDPSTPMQNAEAMARLLPGAVLLPVDGYGHTSLLNRSACADAAIAAYLVDLKSPAPGTRCAQERRPFAD
jgi:hypothetical protein